ncbi:twin-arginine translocase TatA/TatE family subunit [Nonomuraea sp. NPDC003560]
MPNIGPSELIVIAIVGLLFFGAIVGATIYISSKRARRR